MMEPRDATVRAWVAGPRARSHHTARSYQEAVERFLAAVGKPVEEVSVQDALAYAGELSQSGLSRASVAHHISAVGPSSATVRAWASCPQAPWTP